MMKQTGRFSGKIILALFCFLAVLFNSGLSVADDTVCLQCHAGQPEYLSEPIGLWEMSVHKENGISCHDCHGGDPTDFAMAMSPERGFVGVPDDEEIPGFCGKCHVGIKDDYDSSAHGQALGSGGPNCATCHSNHKVEKASLSLINETSCSRCHEYGRAAEIKDALSKTDSRINALEVELKDLHGKGISTREMEGKLFALRNEYHQLFHNLDVDQVVAQSSVFQQRLDEISALAMADQGDLGQRKVFGGVIVVLLVLAGILLLMLKKTYEGRD
jgi:hypothetical protein